MIFLLILVMATVLPFFWEHVVKHALADAAYPNLPQLAIVGLSPAIMALALIGICRGLVDEDVMLGCALFIVVFSTFTWGYTMHYRHFMRRWLWFTMSLLTLCLYPTLFILVVFGSKSTHNLTF
ncbi:MAG: hypothetical protein ACI9UJ_001623 [bacterium]|jgi:hypothetical protein